MADVESNIRINVDTSIGIAEIKNLQRQIAELNSQLLQSGAQQARAAQNVQRNLINNINATGKFAASVKTISSTAESFTSALERNKLSMGEYFRYAGASTKTFGRLFKSEFDTIQKVAESRVKTLQTQYVKLGRDASGALKAIAVRPLALDMQNLGTQTAIAAQKQQLFNQLVKQGSTNLLNFGKNTQWAGRQLMVGFTLPLSMFGTLAAKTFMQMEEQAIRFKRVYGDSFTATEETDKMIKQVKDLANEFTKYGVQVEKTMEMAADAAAMGLEGADLLAQIKQATTLAVLGGVEQEQALETTISLMNAFGTSARDLAGDIDFLNAVENQTVTAIEDLTIAIPKAAPVIKQLGGDVKDLAFFLTAMKEGGINASEGANALKSGLASLINPTEKASEMLKGFGININAIVEANKGDIQGTVVSFARALDQLDPLNRARAIEQLFGKFQFARLSTLFQNVIKEGTQAQRVLELTRSTSEELAILSERELKRVEDSPMYQFKKAVEDIKVSLVPLGEAFLKAITPVIEFGKTFLDRFNSMSDGAKQFAVVATTVVAGIGPVLLMTFGLIANGVANLIKMFAAISNIFRGTGGSAVDLGNSTEYMTQQQLEAAAVAASLDQSHSKLIQTFGVETTAVNNLAAAYGRAVVQQSRLLGLNPETGLPIPGSRGVRPKKYAKGVLRVPGPKGAGDIVPAMLSPGESVIPAKQSEKYAGLIQGMINDDIPGYRFGLNPFAAMLKNSRVTTRMKSDDLRTMLKNKDLRYKSAFETGTGDDYINQITGMPKINQQRLRTRMEETIMGIPYNAPVSSRPTYGSVELTPIGRLISRLFGLPGKQFRNIARPGNEYLDRYGDAELVGKRRLSRRSSIFAGDLLRSFDGSTSYIRRRYEMGPEGSMLPPMRGASKEQLEKQFSNFRHPFGKGIPDGKSPSGGQYFKSNPGYPYIEAHVAGGFNLREISKIRVSNRAEAKQLQKLVDQAGLRIRVTPLNAPAVVKALANVFGTRFNDGVTGAQTHKIASTTGLIAAHGTDFTKLTDAEAKEFALRNITPGSRAYKKFMEPSPGGRGRNLYSNLVFGMPGLFNTGNMNGYDSAKWIRNNRGAFYSFLENIEGLDPNSAAAKSYAKSLASRLQKFGNKPITDAIFYNAVEESAKGIKDKNFLGALNRAKNTFATGEIFSQNGKSRREALAGAGTSYVKRRDRIRKLFGTQAREFESSVGATASSQRQPSKKPTPKSTRAATAKAASQAKSYNLSKILGAGGRAGAFAGLLGMLGLGASMMGSFQQNQYANGVVSVPGPKGKGDVVPAMLSPGEAVIPAKESKKYAPLIQQMVHGKIPGYQDSNVPKGNVSKGTVWSQMGNQTVQEVKVANTAELAKENVKADTRAMKTGRLSGIIKNAPRLFYDEKYISQVTDKATAKVERGIAKLGASKIGQRLDNSPLLAAATARMLGNDITTTSGRTFVGGTGAEATTGGRQRHPAGTVINGKKVGGQFIPAGAATVTQSAPAAPQSRIGMGAVSGIAGMAGMGAMAYGMSGGPGADIASMAAMPLMMAPMLIPMLTNPIGGTALAVAAFAGGMFLLQQRLQEATKSGIETADSMSMTAEKLGDLSEFAGTVSASELAERRRTDQLSSASGGKREFGQNFMESEAGARLLSQAEGLLSQGISGADLADNFANQLSYAVLQGAVTTEQARSIAIGLGEKLGNYSIGVKIAGELTTLLGFNGENLEKDPLRIAIQIQDRSVRKIVDSYDVALSEISENSANDWVANLGGGLTTAATVFGTAAAASLLTPVTAVAAPFLAAAAAITGLAGVPMLTIGNIMDQGDAEQNNRLRAISVQLSSEQLAQNQGIVDSLEQQYGYQIDELQAKLDVAKTDEERLALEEEINTKVRERDNALEIQRQRNNKIFDDLLNNAESLGSGFNDAINKSIDLKFENVTGAVKESVNLAKELLSELPTEQDGRFNQFKATLQLGLASGEFDPISVINLLNASKENPNIKFGFEAVIKATGSTADANQLLQLMVSANAKPQEYSAIFDFMVKDKQDFDSNLEALAQIANMPQEYAISVPVTLELIQEAGNFIDQTAKDLDTGQPLTKEIVLDYIRNGKDSNGNPLGVETLQNLQYMVDNWDVLTNGTNNLNYQVMVDFVIGKYNDAAIQAWFMANNPERFEEMLGRSLDGPIVADRLAGRISAAEQAEMTAAFIGQGSAAFDTGVTGEEEGGGGGGTKEDPYADILNKLKMLRNYTIDAKGGVDELRRAFGRFGNITIFKGMEQLSDIAGFGQEFASYIMGLDEETRKTFVTFKNGNATLTETGELMRKAFQEVAIGDFQFSLVSSLSALASQEAALGVLTEKGMDYSDALEIATNETIALAIASGELKGKELDNLINKVKELRVADETSRAFENLNLAIQEFVQELATEQEVNLNYSPLEAEAILNDGTLLAMAQLGEYGSEQFATRLAQVMGTIEFKESIFEDGFSRAMEAFSVQEQEIELQFAQDNKENLDIIEQTAQQINEINYQIDDYEAGLTRIEREEELINEKYEKRFEALDRIEEANEAISRQQKSQLTIADALTRGDIAAAAKAVQEARAQEASARTQQTRDMLELAQENELAALKTEINGISFTRAEIEEKVKSLQEQIFELEEQKLEPAQRAVELAEIAKQKRIEELDVLGKTRTEWEKIKNEIDLARINSEAYQRAIQNALNVIPGLTESYQQPVVPQPTPEPAPATPEPATPEPAPAPAAPTTKTYVVKRGDTLSGIAKKFYGSTSEWRKIYNANRGIIGNNPNLIYAGQKFTIPMAMGGMVPGYMGGGKIKKYAMGGKVGYYPMGGLIPYKAMGGLFKSVNTDTVPAMLTAGEFVVRRSAVENFGADKLKSINNGTYAGDSVYNYSVNVNVKSDANADEIARSVMNQIKRIDSQRIRGNRF